MFLKMTKKNYYFYYYKYHTNLMKSKQYFPYLLYLGLHLIWPYSQNFHWSWTLFGRLLKVFSNLLHILKLKIILPFDNWQDLFAFRVIESRTCFKTLWCWSNVSFCHLMFFLGWSTAKIKARLKQCAITRLHLSCLNEYL